MEADPGGDDAYKETDDKRDGRADDGGHGQGLLGERTTRFIVVLGHRFSLR